jgi:hypothetical protein
MASKTIWIVASGIVVAMVRFAPDGVRDRSVVSPPPPPPECGPHADHTGERNLNLDAAATHHHCPSVLRFLGRKRGACVGANMNYRAKI